MPIKISHFCFALAHLSIMLDSAAAPCCGKQTVQCSWAPQDSERGILIPFFFFFFPFGTSQIYLVIKKGTAPPPSEKDWEVRTQIMPEPHLQT